MSRMHWRVVVALSCTAFLCWLAAPGARAELAFCTKVQKYAGKTLVTKVPVYDTEIGPEGITELKRDEEEFPPGTRLTIKKVSCVSRRVVFRVFSPDYPQMDSTEVYFYFDREQRAAAHDPMAIFDRMVGYVFQEPSNSTGQN